MDIATRSWLLSELGDDTDLADLEARYARLGSARAVAIEVLKQRKATLLASPLVLGVSNVVNVSYAANIAALERQITALEDPNSPPAPGEPGFGEPATEAGTHLTTIQLHARRRR